MVKNKDFSVFKKIYDPEQLEKKFGGKMEDLTKFWPPFNTMPNATRNVSE